MRRQKRDGEAPGHAPAALLDNGKRRVEAAQLALLGTDDDEAIAKRIGKTPVAVRVKRTRLRIAKFHDKRRKG